MQVVSFPLLQLGLLVDPERVERARPSPPEADREATPLAAIAAISSPPSV